MRIVSYVIVTLGTICVTGCSADIDAPQNLMSSNQMDLLERFNCEQTVKSYAHSRDQVDWQKNIALFTEDAVMQLGATRLEGRDEIKAALLERGPKKFSRHIIASVSVEKSAKGELSGTSYVVVYNADPTIKGPKPLTEKSVEVILTYNDTFDLNDNRCMIAKRIVTLDMVKQNEQ